MTKGPFMTRYSNHKSSFCLPQYRNATKLSEALWTLKDSATPYTIKWDIVKCGTLYKNGKEYCNLCTTEKVKMILRSKDPQLINSTNEIMAKCRLQTQEKVSIMIHFHPSSPPFSFSRIFSFIAHCTLHIINLSMLLIFLVYSSY